MKLFGAEITKKARDIEWGFSEASLARYSAGKNGCGVLICHGFGGTPANMLPLYERAVSLGCSAALPLLKGHAETLGKMELCGRGDWRADVDAALEKLVEEGCDRIFLCGLSMGALLMADLAERKAGLGLIDGLMMISPPIKMKKYLNACSFFAPVIPYVLTADKLSDDPVHQLYPGTATKKLKEIGLLSRDVRHHAASLKLPVTIVQAGRDDRVDPVSYKILKDRVPGAVFRIIPEAPHGIPYSPFADELCDIFEEFLKQAG